jgi:hypothetical protein
MLKYAPARGPYTALHSEKRAVIKMTLCPRRQASLIAPHALRHIDQHAGVYKSVERYPLVRYEISTESFARAFPLDMARYGLTKNANVLVCHGNPVHQTHPHRTKFVKHFPIKPPQRDEEQ